MFQRVSLYVFECWGVVLHHKNILQAKVEHHVPVQVVRMLHQAEMIDFWCEFDHIRKVTSLISHYQMHVAKLFQGQICTFLLIITLKNVKNIMVKLLESIWEILKNHDFSYFLLIFWRVSQKGVFGRKWQFSLKKSNFTHFYGRKSFVWPKLFHRSVKKYCMMFGIHWYSIF